MNFLIIVGPTCLTQIIQYFVHYHCGLKLHTGTTLRVFQSMSRNKNACHMRVKPTTSTMLTAV